MRRAVYQAIDIDLILQKVLRGQAAPTGAFMSKLVDGYVPELDQRLKYDPAAARALLKEAGYAEGFGVTLDCVNIAFREAVCQAIAAMLTQVGIRVTPALDAGGPVLSQADARRRRASSKFGWTPTHRPWAILTRCSAPGTTAATAPSTPAATRTRSSTR